MKQAQADLVPLPEVPLDREDSFVEVSESFKGSWRQVEVVFPTWRTAVPNASLDTAAIGGVGDGTESRSAKRQCGFFRERFEPLTLAGRSCFLRCAHRG